MIDNLVSEIEETEFIFNAISFIVRLAYSYRSCLVVCCYIIFLHVSYLHSIKNERDMFHCFGIILWLMVQHLGQINKATSIPVNTGIGDLWRGLPTIPVFFQATQVHSACIPFAVHVGAMSTDNGLGLSATTGEETSSSA